MRVPCLPSLQPPPSTVPLNLPWPPLTKPLHPQGSQSILWPDVCPHTQRSWAQIHKSPAPRTDCSLKANKCLFGPLLPDPVPRQGGDWPFSEMTQDGWGVIISKPKKMTVRAHAQILLLHSYRHQDDEVTLFHHWVQKCIWSQRHGMYFWSHSHGPNTIVDVQFLYLSSGSRFFCLLLSVDALKMFSDEKYLNLVHWLQGSQF